MPKSRHALLVLLLLSMLSLTSLFLALGLGSMSIAWPDVFDVLLGISPNEEHSTQAAILLDLRLPRALAGFACGALLALAGSLMQVLLRNPLADPYVLGISGGAGVGALAAMLFGLASWLISSSAFIGALAAMLLVFGLSRHDSSRSQTGLLLTGVVVAAGCGAVVALILSIAPEQKIHGMLFWLMGDLSQASAPLQPLLTLVVLLLLTLPQARALNLLSRGTLPAQALGVAVPQLRRAIYLLASFATAMAVTTAGSIGFVGLVVPHLTRLAIGPALGNDHRLLIPASVLAGGSLLVLADTLARIVIAPMQLPVGVLTALIGVPVFLFLLGRNRQIIR